MIDPPHWTAEQLQQSLEVAIERFRKERLEEPLEAYLEAFDEYQGAVEDLLEITVDLTQLDNNALDILTDTNLLEAFRYVAGPFISADDLKTLADAKLSTRQLRANPDMAERIVRVVLGQLDRRRFSWVSENREPTESERSAAVLASAAVMATQRAGTKRRNLSRNEQEEKVEAALLQVGMTQVQTRTVNMLNQAPAAGEFCRESKLGSAKADFIIGLYDDRKMALECKVSNTSTNSVKRLNREAAAKAGDWRRHFGERPIIPTAVLSGVYKLHNLQQAQDASLTLIWAHDLDALTSWIDSTKP